MRAHSSQKKSKEKQTAISEMQGLASWASGASGPCIPRNEMTAEARMSETTQHLSQSEIQEKVFLEYIDPKMPLELCQKPHALEKDLNYVRFTDEETKRDIRESRKAVIWAISNGCFLDNLIPSFEDWLSISIWKWLPEKEKNKSNCMEHRANYRLWRLLIDDNAWWSLFFDDDELTFSPSLFF